MSNQRFPKRFKIQAVNQETEKQLSVSEVTA
jgi:transposase-like protein